MWVACLWVAQELARDTVPFGGFPWGRLAFAETDSPFTSYAALGGAPLVSFATALCGALVAAAALQRSSWARAVPLAAAALAVPAVGALLPVRGRRRGARSRWPSCRAGCPAPA